MVGYVEVRRSTIGWSNITVRGDNLLKILRRRSAGEAREIAAGRLRVSDLLRGRRLLHRSLGVQSKPSGRLLWR